MVLKALGGLALEDNDFSRHKPLLLLCYLALEGSKERRFLAELFWPRSEDRLNSLSKALTRLRQSAPNLIEADAIRVWTTVQTDVEEMLSFFEGEQVERGLELYKGPFLEGVYLPDWSTELEEWLYTTREFLAERVRAALLQRAEKMAAQGDFKKAAKHAETAYRLPSTSGLEPEELERVYKLLLAGESPYTREAEKEMAKFGLKRSLNPDEARACYTMNTAPETPFPHNLPTRINSFVGRSRELARTIQLFSQDECRLITLTGVGGSGKTSLACETAYRCLDRERFKDGVFFVPLETLTSAEATATSIASAITLDLQGKAEPFVQLKNYLHNKAMLLVLDNFEHLTEAATLVSDLLGACPYLKVLTTSRERLNLAEEWILPLVGLSLPTENVEHPGKALASEAVQLFVQRAQQADVNFVLSEDNLTDVAAICRLLDGYPLGIEMAAVWVRSMPCSEIASEIEKNLDFLQVTTRNVKDRHRSIRAVFEHSWKLLKDREQTVLRKLAIFRGSFRREAAAEVAGATVPVLASLVDKSLLYVAPSGRYNRHPLLYQFVKEKLLEQPNEESQAQDRHATYYLHFLEEIVEREMFGPRHKHALEAIEEELENVIDAWRWMAASASPKEAQNSMMLTFAIQEFYDRRGRFQEGINLFNEALLGLNNSDSMHHLLLGNVLVNHAYLFHKLARYEEAKRLAKRGLTLLQPAKERWGEVLGLYTLGLVAQHQGEVHQAETHYQQGLHIIRELQNRFGYAGVNSFLYALGSVRQALGDYSGAEHAYREVLSLGQAQGNHINVVRSLNALGNLLRITGRLDEAHSLLRQALQLLQQVDFQDLTPQSLIYLGALAYDRGDYTKAQALFQKALLIVQKSGDEALRAQAFVGLGRVAVAQHEYIEAQSYLVQALKICWAFQGIPLAHTVLLEVANLQAAQGQLEQVACLASCLLQQPAVARYEKDLAQRLLDAIRDQLPPQAMKVAIVRGKAMQLEDAVKAILRQET